MIRFLFNSTVIALENSDITLSTLDWVRTKMGKTGTKEGCATGDCGACTILLGELKNPEDPAAGWHYKSINSCLMPIANAHGKHIVTVEALTTTTHPTLEQLHPVQRAIVECHGSQCGFCTPGFIMSLAALYINHTAYPGTHKTLHALGGNLCRCTGYQPILHAAKKSFTYPRVEHEWDEIASAFRAELAESSSIPAVQDGSRSFYIPQNLSQLLQLKHTHPQARLVAGGTDISLEVSQQLSEPEVLISVTQVSDLRAYHDTDSGLIIGGALPYSDFVDRFYRHFPESKELFERLGATQVRNAGTLAGSLANASPIGDPAPLLIALQAKVVLANVDGEREVLVADFFTGYRQTVMADNEVIKHIVIPPRSAATKLACYKVSKRFEDDISTVCLVVAADINANRIVACRIAAGGMAATPLRASKTEMFLADKPLELKVFKQAAEILAEDFTPLSDMRASAHYRTQSAGNLLHRTGMVFCKLDIAVATNAPLRIAHAAL